MSAALSVPDEDEPEVDELYDPNAWDRWAAQMQRITDFHATEGQHSKAAYFRPFIARFRQAAARLRRFNP